MKLAFKSCQHGILVFKCLALQTLNMNIWLLLWCYNPVRVWVSYSGSYWQVTAFPGWDIKTM